MQIISNNIRAMRQAVYLFMLLFLPVQLSAQYCTPDVQMACFYGDKIVNVTFAGINHTDDVCDADGDGKKDFTTTIAPGQVTVGNSYTISIAVENSLPSGTERVRIWIDFDQDYQLEATESFDIGVGTGNTTLSATIAIPANAVAGTTRMRVMYRRSGINDLNDTDACHSYGNYRGQLKDYAVTVNTSSACTSALTPGNTISTLSSACPGEPFTLSLQNTVNGPTYQWQNSPDGTTWTNIPLAVNATFTTSQASAKYYRCVVTCDNNTGTSNPLQTASNGPVYTTLPVHESFESWSNLCGGISNVPGSSWLTTPATGNASFRREDQGATASWNNATSGQYTPQASTGNHSARFHTTGNPTGVQGKLDLYVDCSVIGNQQRLTFDYLNAGGSDQLALFISTDGGTNFAAVGAALTTSPGWTTQTRTFTAASATTILRFVATSDGQPSDIGIDNLALETVVNCTPPTALTASPVGQTTATVSWTAPVPGPGSGYEYVLSTSNVTPVGNGTAYGMTTMNHFNLQPNTNYYFFIRSYCGGGIYSSWVSVPFRTKQSTVGLNEQALADGISVFPNPASQTVQIGTTSGIEIEKLSLYTITGEYLMELPVLQNGAPIPLGEIANGLYLLLIDTAHGRAVQRLVISK